MAKVRAFFIAFGILACLGIAAVPGVYFYKKYTDSQKQLASQNITQADPESKKKEILDKVAKHYAVPEGEIPTVLTISEKEKLMGQEFFTKAKNGDILIVYYAAKKAILYDPVTDRILEIGPVTIHNTPTQTPMPDNRVPIVNDSLLPASPSGQPSPTTNL